MKQLHVDDVDEKESRRSKIRQWSIAISAFLIFAIMLSLAIGLVARSVDNLTINDGELYEIVSENLGVDEDKMIITKEKNHVYKVETDDAIYKMKVSLDKKEVTNTVIVEIR